ncbi:hypothetical protein ACIG3E_15475 [Streptomyces sp. NPDC053474]|uniref:hypothetical protein n=1 Tax=Streptomyces sp. NPDC053474 TaxID=3365704 RepID=UPI0037D33DEA
MPDDSPPPRRPAPRRRGPGCCLPLAVLPLAWLLAAALLPGEAGRGAGWGPLWVAALVWNGADGRGGISHLLG